MVLGFCFFRIVVFFNFGYLENMLFSDEGIVIRENY